MIAYYDWHIQYDTRLDSTNDRPTLKKNLKSVNRDQISFWKWMAFDHKIPLLSMHSLQS